MLLINLCADIFASDLPEFVQLVPLNRFSLVTLVQLHHLEMLCISKAMTRIRALTEVSASKWSPSKSLKTDSA
jgi:hypothetical protein